VKFIQTRLGYVEDTRTNVNRSICRTSPWVYRFLLLPNFSKRRCDYENLVLRSLPPHHISHPNASKIIRRHNFARPPVLLNTTLFINVYKFFSKSFFACILNPVLSSMYSRSHGNCANCSTRWIFTRDEYTAASFDNVWRNAIYCIIVLYCDDGIAPGIAKPRESPSAIINHEIGTIHGNSGAD